MKKIVLLSFVVGFFLTSSVVLAAGEATGTYDEYEYNGYTELPSEQSLAEIQQMTQYDGVYSDRELRAKPGGGPGLGEMPIPLDLAISNMVILSLSCVAAVIFKICKNRRKRVDG